MRSFFTPKSTFLALILAAAASGAHAQPTVTMSVPLNALEATGTKDFILTRAGADLSGTTTVDFIVGGSAVSPSDYTRPGVSAQICDVTACTFNPFETEKRIRFNIVGDTSYELNETISVGITGILGGSFVGFGGTHQILNDDPLPVLRISDRVVAENVAGGTTTFTVTRVGSTNLNATFSCTHVGTGLNPASVADYNIPSCAGTIGPGIGSASTVVTVNILDNLVDEFDETFEVTLTSPGNATIGVACGPSCANDGVGVGTISDNEPLSVLQIGDVSVLEGNGGTVAMTFPVTLSPASAKNITVMATPTNTTALSGSPSFDYVNPGPITLTFSAGNTVPDSPLTIFVNGDTKNENDETLRVWLTGAVNATIAGGGLNNGDGTIQNDDSVPTVSITPLVNVVEGTDPQASFAITLSAPSGKTVSVRATTTAVTATAGVNGDYIDPGAITYTFTEGQTSYNHLVTINDDGNDEHPTNDETFNVTLSLPVNTTIVGTPAIGEIEDDDDHTDLTLRINDRTVKETGANQNVQFNVVMSGTSWQPVTFEYSTADGPPGPLGATASSDYTAQLNVPLTIAVGATTSNFIILVKGDAIAEASETFTVTLGNPVGASFEFACGVCTTDGIGVGTIDNDDASTAADGLIISEFRVRGAAGPLDEFVEIGNKTTSPIFVTSIAPSTGLTVATPGGPLFTVPNGTLIPAGGRFLGTNNAVGGYSLSTYATSEPGANWTANIPDADTGVGLFNNSVLLDGTTLIDAVGFGSVPSPYFETAALPNSYDADGQYSHVRRSVSGAPVDTDDNASDFQFVATHTAANIGPTSVPLGPFASGVLPSPYLGSPGPENLAGSTVVRDPGQMTQLTPGSDTVVPNRLATPKPFFYNGTREFSPSGANGAISVRRTFTNPLSATTSVTTLRFRAVGMTTQNGPTIYPSNQADVRWVNSDDQNDATTGLVDVKGITLDNGVSLGNEGGGFNTSGTVTLPTPLAPGDSINIQFRLAIQTSGNFLFLVNIEAVEVPFP